jgi:hypothetical protein
MPSRSSPPFPSEVGGTREEHRKIFRKKFKIFRCYKNRKILNLKIGKKISKIDNFLQKSAKNREKISKIDNFLQKSGKNFKNRPKTGKKFQKSGIFCINRPKI